MKKFNNRGKIMKKTLVLFMVIIMFALSAIGCNTRIDDGSATTTVINVSNAQGGVGDIWLKEAAERFERLKAEESYAEGKTGVVIKWDSTGIPATDSMRSDGNQLYFSLNAEPTMIMAAKSAVLSIEDVLDADLSAYGETGTIRNKLDETHMSMLKGGDGKVYTLPHAEIFYGLTYKVDLFENEGLYFANSGNANFQSAYGAARFVSKASGETLSYGPDGVGGTSDDGFPVSMEEFLLLCSKMMSVGIRPLGLSGKYQQYGGDLLSAFLTSLAGADKVNAMYSLDGTTDIDVVTGYSSEPLFPGIGHDSIKTPITTKIKLTEENGYKSTAMVERYYATALMEIFMDEGWFSKSYLSGSTHTEEQQYFIYSGESFNGVDLDKIGMLIEGSYWYNESEMAGIVDTYMNDMQTDSLNVEIMPLPLQLKGRTADSNNKKQVIYSAPTTLAYVNANIANNDELRNASLDFLTFLYTNAELANFTKSTGLTRAVNYDTDDFSSFSVYHQSIFNLKANSTMVYPNSTTETMLAQFKSYGLGPASSLFKVGTSYFAELLFRGSSAQSIFDSTCRTAW